ncbi:MAG: transcription termination/antitermination protein NusG [Planctomycetia bacterium]
MVDERADASEEPSFPEESGAVAASSPAEADDGPAFAAESGSEPEPESAPEPELIAEPVAVATPAAAEATAPVDPDAPEMHWYVLKVNSNREGSIRDAIARRVKIHGLEHLVSEVVVPTEKVTEIKDGKKRVLEKKFFPGYIMLNLHLNDDTWFVVRETPGVGDFVGSGGKPVPMTSQDVAKMLGRVVASEDAVAEAPKLKISFHKGDRVKIKEGTFENFEGAVDEVNEGKGLVRVMIQIFGRPTPVELEYWQIEAVE